LDVFFEMIVAGCIEQSGLTKGTNVGRENGRLLSFDQGSRSDTRN